MKIKRINIIGSILIVLLIGVVLFCFSYCSKPTSKDKFIGIWNDEKGYKKIEITKDDSNKYSYQTYSNGEKGALYRDGFISEEGYLLFDIDSKFYGFEYKSENKIARITLNNP